MRECMPPGGRNKVLHFIDHLKSPSQSGSHNKAPTGGSWLNSSIDVIQYNLVVVVWERREKVEGKKISKDQTIMNRLKMSGCVRFQTPLIPSLILWKVFLGFEPRANRSVPTKWEFFMKMRAAFLLSPSFITWGRKGARKSALILMKHFHFDKTPQLLDVGSTRCPVWRPITLVVSISNLRFLPLYSMWGSKGKIISPKNITWKCLAAFDE